MNLIINTYPLLAAAGDILNNATASATDARVAADAMWTALYTGSPIFGEIAKFCMGIAFLFLIIRIYRIFEEYQDNFDITKVFKSLLIPLIILILLSRSGAPAKYLTYGLRNLTSNFGVNIIGNVGSDLGNSEIKNGIPQGTIADQLLQEFSVKLDRCRLVPRSEIDSPEICVAAELARLKQKIQAAGITSPTITSYLDKVTQQVQDKLNAAAGSGNAGWSFGDVFKGIPSLTNLGEQIVISILNAITIGFFWAIELSGLIYFYLLPVSLAMGMIDSKAIADWFTSYWALCNAKICFAIVLSLIGQISVSVTGISFVLELLMAFFAPFITFVFCRGSAIAMAEGITAIGSGAVKGGVSAAAKGTVGGFKGLRNFIGGKLAARAKAVSSKE